MSDRCVSMTIPGWFMMKGCGEMGRALKETRWRYGWEPTHHLENQAIAGRHSIAYDSFLVALDSVRFVMHIPLASYSTTSSFAVSAGHSAWTSSLSHSLAPYAPSHPCPRLPSPSTLNDPRQAEAIFEDHYHPMRSSLDPSPAQSIQPEDCLASRHSSFPCVTVLTGPSLDGEVTAMLRPCPRVERQDPAHCSSGVRLLIRWYFLRAELERIWTTGGWEHVRCPSRFSKARSMLP